MDPISLIVGALAAGATTGLKDTTTDALKDAYAGLRELVRRRFAGRRVAEMALIEHEKAPDTWRQPLVAELAAAGADADTAIIAAAQRVMTIAGDTSGVSGKYTISIQDANGAVVGDSNTQVNTFSPTQPRM